MTINAGEQKRVVIVGTGDGTNNVQINFETTLDNISNPLDFIVWRAKAELGNKATDWTPAPEDTQSQIDGLGSRMTTAETSITQLSNQIALKANQSTVDNLTNQVTSLSAQLSVQAGQIATKVEKNGVISAINQTAESIKIQASKVDLSGYVTFTNLSTPGQTTIDGGNIKANSITVEKLIIGDFTNLCVNPDFLGGKLDKWSGGVTAAIDSKAAEVPTGAPTAYVGKQTNRDGYCGDRFPVKPGDKFYVEFTAATGNSTYSFTVGLVFFDANGATISWIGSGYLNPTSSWTTRSGTVTAPSGAVTARVWSQINGPAGSTGTWYFSRVIVRRMAVGELIVDGSITTEKLAAKSITADKLNVTSLSAISGNLGTVNAGIINGVQINTSSFSAQGGGIYGGGNVYIRNDPNNSPVIITTDINNPDVERLSLEAGAIYLQGNATDEPRYELFLHNYGFFNYATHSDGSVDFISISPGGIYVNNENLDGSSEAFDIMINNGNGNLFVNANLYCTGMIEATGWLYTDDLVITNEGVLIYSDARHILMTETDNNDKQWHIEVNNGALNFVETNIATRMTISSGQIAVTGNLNVNGTVFGKYGWFNGHTIELTNTSLSNIYIRPQSGGEVRATRAGTTDSYVPVRASSFPTGSLAEYKEDIRPWEESALEKIRQATIYEYYLKSELEQGIYRKRQGLVVGEGYNTPDGVIDGDGVEQYLMNAWSWKAIQELDNEQQSLKDRIAWLEIENQYLKQKIQQLEGMIS